MVYSMLPQMPNSRGNILPDVWGPVLRAPVMREVGQQHAAAVEAAVPPAPITDQY